MRLHIPTGLTAILASFDQVLIALNCLGTESESLVSTSFRGRLEPAYRQLVELSNDHAHVKHAWSQHLIQRNEELGTLRRLVRDAWLMLRRRDQREGRQGLLIGLYQLPALAPPHASAAVWLQYARYLVQGEAQALAAGYAPMAYPSADELEHSLARTERAESNYQLQCLRLKDAETALRQQQRLACHLLRRLAARLRESQFDQDPGRTRTLLRCFGYRFTSTPSDDAEALAELARSETKAPQLLAPTETSADRATPARTEAERPDSQPEAPAQVAPSTNWIETLRTWTWPPKLERLRGHGARAAC